MRPPSPGGGPPAGPPPTAPDRAVPPRLGLPHLGLGVGLRGRHLGELLRHDAAVDWLEVITENLLGDAGGFRHAVDRLATRYPLVLHGVSLSVGSADPLDLGYVDAVAALADELDAAWVSDHLCWTGVAGRNTHDLLPLPLTEECLEHVATRVMTVQARLGRPLVLENPSTYLEWQASTLPEWEFLARLCRATGCGLLLDVNNVHVSCHNHGWDPSEYLAGVPPEHVVQLHVSGPSPSGPLLVDTHVGPVPVAVWRLFLDAQARTGGVPTLLEWDTGVPPLAVLEAELDTARRLLDGSLALAELEAARRGQDAGDAPAAPAPPTSNPLASLVAAP